MHTPHPSPPVEVLSPPPEAVSILLPDSRTLFAERAKRFTALAPSHSLGDWLSFLGRLTAAQQVAAQTLGALAPPPAAVLEHARRHGMPPLNPRVLARPAPWQAVLDTLIDSLLPHAPTMAQARLNALRRTSAGQREALATSVLNACPDPTAAAELPLVGAALQVVWTRLASELDPSALTRLDTPGLCPCCGSRPVASIVRLAAEVNNLRYLHCALCNTEWQHTRATCSACETDRGVAYQQIEGSSGAVRAESCDACHSYLKIVYQEKDPAVDPVADDLATLALDLLMDQAGYGRSGPNLLLIGGSG